LRKIFPIMKEDEKPSPKVEATNLTQGEK